MSLKKLSTVQNKELARHKPAYLTFNGKELSWYEDEKPIKSWRGMSGKKGYQCKEYTDVTDNGPIPEGKWILRKGSAQHYNPEELTFGDRIKNRFDRNNKWKTNPEAWGNSRIRIEPADDTNTKGRTDMYAHGGKTFGSGGCIDLANGMEDFYKDFSNYGNDLIMNVKYDDDCW